MPWRFLAAVLWLLPWLAPALAEPRTGPDRPFTVDWEVAVPPVTHPLAVHFADTRTGWTVGSEGAILLTGDGGESWRRPRTPPSTRATLLDVAFAADGRAGLAVGELGTILLTGD